MPGSFPQRLLWLALALALSASNASPAAARARRDPNATPLKTVFLTKPAPDFGFDSAAGAQRLRDYAGRPVVLNFWATWCEPCRDELGAFAKIAPTYGPSVGLLTVNYEGAGKARQFLEEHGFTLPVVEDSAHRIFDLYSVVPLPVTIVVSRTGTVSKVIVGELAWDELRTDIDAELGPAPAPPAPAPVAPAPALPATEQHN